MLIGCGLWSFNCSVFLLKELLLLMGAPKQKWTAEEEAALKAGVIKHGAGKWRTILTDPEFSSILHLRSNVDLKVSLCIPLPVILNSNRKEV